jgi:hypothetical protein
MLRNRMLMVLGGCFLASGAAWADGVAYVDCASHPEVTQVFGKPRRTPETVAGIPCGERFTVLQYGFIFSRIQTKDGQIGYVYSNLISADRSGAVVPQPAPSRATAAPSTVPSATTTVAPPTPIAPAQPQATSIHPSPAETPIAAVDATKATASSVQATGTPVQSSAAPTAQTQTAVQPVPAPVTATAPSAPETRVSTVPPTSAAPEQHHLPPAPSVLIETAAPAATATDAPKTVDAPETSAAQPETPAAQPEPAPAIRSVSRKESWEKPNPVAHTVGVRNVSMPRLPLIELFGGYGYARLNNGAGYVTNSNGVLGAFGWNIKPWLQLIADSSYNRVTVSGTKNVLYGNHWGLRYFHRLRHSWGAAPFVEGLIGGSRADVTVSGTGGYSTSDTALSYKIGGGVDIHPLKHFEIRVIDFDYYRTSFGTNLHQNNYFISTGIVMRLFGRSEE